MVANLFFNKSIEKIRKKGLGRKGIKKRIKDLKKSSYGKNWQKVDPDFYSRIYNYRPLLHQNFLEYLKNKEDVKSVLEIGCGIGTYPIEFKKYFDKKDYLGIDIGNPAIKYCKQNSNFEFMCGDIIDMELDKKFDLVFSHAVIDHVYDIDAFIKKIVNLSKKHVYVSAYRGYFPDLDVHKMRWDNEKGCYYNDLSIEQLKNNLLRMGLVEDEINIRKQEDGTELNQIHSIGLDGFETVIEIIKKS